MSTIIRLFFKSIIPIVALAFIHTVFAADDSFESHVNTTSIHGVTFIEYRIARPKGVVLWVHGGPFGDPVEAALKSRSAFFQNLNEQGYDVVAPAITMEQVAESGKGYKNILNKTAQWISTTYPHQNVILMTHSKGGHWAGQTLRDGESALRRLSKKWVFIGGASHQGASSLRQFVKFGTGPFTLLDALSFDIPLMENLKVQWENVSPLNSSVLNKSIFNKLRYYRDWRASQIDTLSQHGFKDQPDLINPVLSPELIADLSISYHTSELPMIPILVIHPLTDYAVSVDTAHFFVNKLLASKHNASLFVGEKGCHNWMTNSMREKGLEVFTLYYDRIIDFINYENSEGAILADETAKGLALIESLLKNYPQLDYVGSYDKFIKNEELEIAIQGNAHPALTELNIDQIEGLPKIKLKGLRDAIEIINKFADVWKNNQSDLDSFNN